MQPDLSLLSTLFGSNYPCLELIFMVPNVFEPLKFDFNDSSGPRLHHFKVNAQIPGRPAIQRASCLK